MKATLASVVALWLVGFALPTSAQEAAASSKAASPDTPEKENEDAAEPEEFDEQTFGIEFQALLSKGEFDEAEKQLLAALENAPDSPRLKSLHYTLFLYLRQAGRNEQAFGHLNTYVKEQLQSAASRGPNVETFANYLGLLVDQAANVGGAEKAAAVLDDFKARAESFENNENLLAAIDTQHAIHLGKTGHIDQARAMIEAQVEAATNALSESPAGVDNPLVLRKANALKNRTKLESVVEEGNEAQAWSELLDFLHEKAHEDSAAVVVVNRFQSETLGRAAMLARTDPDAADALIDRLESFNEAKTPEATDDAESPLRRRLLANMENQIAALRKQIEKSRKMLALIGTDAMYPQNVDGWVNGDALTPDSLKGKVVLLDFFAVWCGPCIATFPHLREWHDEFTDQGLQIIGVTNYYQYGWDDTVGRAAKQQELEPEAERTAMEQFVKHHELRHPIAYVTSREMQDFYAVSGIPHAVVIDRQGKVRLFRIGSGDQNAADLKRAIEDCLAESAPTG